MIPFSYRLTTEIMSNYFEFILVDSCVELEGDKTTSCFTEGNDKYDFFFMHFIASNKIRNLDVAWRYLLSKNSFIYGSETKNEPILSKLS